MSPFSWQFSKSKPLTELSYRNLSQKYDHFGREFKIGDRVLQVVLMSSVSCCGFKQLLVQLHEASIPLLESRYSYHITKMGIPRYVLNT